MYRPVMDAGRLHRLARMLREIATAATAEAGDDRVSAGDLAIIEDLARYDGTTVGEVARRTGLAQSLVSTTVAGLRRGGVVTSEPDPGDRRRTLITIEGSVREHVFSERALRPVDVALRFAVRTADPDVDDAEVDARVETAGRLLDELATLLSDRR